MRTIQLSEIHVKRSKPKEVETLKKNNELVFPCKNERNLARWTPVIYRYLQIGERPDAGISAEKRSPRSRSRSRCRSTTRFPEHCGKKKTSGIISHQNETLCSQIRVPDSSELNWCPETNWNRALMYFMRQPSMITGILMETSHCLNPASV